MLSDQVFHFFGRTINVTSNEQFLAILALAIAATFWAVRLFRRRRVVVLHRSPVSDQLAYELSRIADALDRIANRPVDQMIASVSNKSEESTGRIPYSMFGR